MPVRIKPSYDLGPCRVFFEGIKGICERVVRDFPNARFGAVDGTWEVYDESKRTFLEFISTRKTLDEFIVYADKEEDQLTLKIVLGAKEASVYLVASPDYQEWFEHFLIDLQKHLEKPDLAQILAYLPSSRIWSFERLFFILVMLITTPKLVLLSDFSAPYCRIIIHKRPPDEFVENVKANIVSNIIWTLMVFILGVITTLITTGKLRL